MPGKGRTATRTPGQDGRLFIATYNEPLDIVLKTPATCGCNAVAAPGHVHL
jgi:hypothetical protein